MTNTYDLLISNVKQVIAEGIYVLFHILVESSFKFFFEVIFKTRFFVKAFFGVFAWDMFFGN